MVMVVRKPVDKLPELSHHGIKGQRWGKKNGPPYPLDYDSHSSAEKKQNSKLTIDGDADTGKKRKGLTDEQKALAKKILKGVAITAGVAAVAAVSYKAIESGVFDDVINTGKNYASILPEIRQGANEYGYTVDEKLTEKTEEAIDRVASGTNPSDNMHNCVGTVGTMALRRMGIDVVAKESGSALDISQIKEIFKGYDSSDHEKYLISEPKSSKDAINKIVSTISGDKTEYPEGSFGILYANNRKRGLPGHAVYWEVLNDKVILSEPQGLNRGSSAGIIHEKGRNYASPDEYFDIVGKGLNKDSFVWGRLDNCKVAFSQISRIADPNKR